MIQRDAHVEPEATGSGDTSSWRGRLAWPLGTLGILLSLTNVVLVFLNRSAIHSLDQADPIQVVLPLGYSIIGALLVSRRPRNPIGWIFLGIGIFTGLPGISTQYVFRSAHFHRLPLVAWVAWTNDWMVWLVFPTGLAAFFFLLFPDGRFQSHRWRRLGWASGVILVAGVVLNMLEKTI
ncbi:MAG TPA: hypothetical protein VF972_00205, partial [Actinomycetota bacterium]